MSNQMRLIITILRGEGKSLRILFFSIFLLGTSYSWSLAPVGVAPNFKFIAFNEHYDLYIDSSSIWKMKGLLTLAQTVKFTPHFKPYLRHLSPYPVILRFRFFTSDSPPSVLIFDIRHADIDYLQLGWIDQAGKTFISRMLGDQFPFCQRYKNYPFYAIPVLFKPNSSYELFVALHKPDRLLTAEMELSTDSYWASKALRRTLLDGLLFGLFSPFLIIGIILYFFLRDRIYLYYSAYALMVMLILLAIKGYSYAYLFPDNAALQQYFLVYAQILGLVFLNLYAFRFLAIELIYPLFCWLRYTILLVYVVFFILTLLLTHHFFPNNKFIDYSFQFFVALNFVFLLLAPVWFYIKTGSNVAVVFFISFLTVCLSGLWNIFSFFFPAIRYILLVDSLAVGLFLEMLILSVFMVYQYRSLLRKQQQFQNELSDQKDKAQIAFVHGQELEKKNVSVYIHDHILSEILILLKSIRKTKKIVHQVDDVSETISHAESMVLKINQDLRNLSYQLVPVALEELGIVDALKQLLNAAHYPFQVHFHADYVSQGRLKTMEMHIYRIVQELLKNAEQHSGAQHVMIQLFDYDTHIQLQYEDDGIGFSKQNYHRGVGLYSIDLRTSLMKGDVTIDTMVGRGLSILITIPIQPVDYVN